MMVMYSISSIECKYHAILRRWLQMIAREGGECCVRLLQLRLLFLSGYIIFVFVPHKHMAHRTLGSKTIPQHGESLKLDGIRYNNNKKNPPDDENENENRELWLAISLSLSTPSNGIHLALSLQWICVDVFLFFNFFVHYRMQWIYCVEANMRIMNECYTRREQHSVCCLLIFQLNLVMLPFSPLHPYFFTHHILYRPVAIGTMCLAVAAFMPRSRSPFLYGRALHEYPVNMNQYKRLRIRMPEPDRITLDSSDVKNVIQHFRNNSYSSSTLVRILQMGADRNGYE